MADGIPIPGIQWLMEGHIIQTEENDRFQVIEEVVFDPVYNLAETLRSTLKIDNVTERDSGMYLCRASNDVGTDPILQEPYLLNVPDGMLLVVNNNSMCTSSVCSKHSVLHKLAWPYPWLTTSLPHLSVRQVRKCRREGIGIGGKGERWKESLCTLSDHFIFLGLQSLLTIVPVLPAGMEVAAPITCPLTAVIVQKASMGLTVKIVSLALAIKARNIHF